MSAPALTAAARATLAAGSCRGSGGVEAGRRVLDVAAGTGNVALLASERGTQVTATDLSPHMLELGRARTEGLGIDWAQADASAGRRGPFAFANPYLVIVARP